MERSGMMKGKMTTCTENGKYMIRKKFYVPKKEIERAYFRDGDLHPSDVILPCDFEEEDD